ncbi:MAG: NAD(P)-dependent oxidoreductase [Candidatus Binatia bacterium]|nr:NAD(P)-dependent oxidoreductase [Candidatus Binatia bacterium]
MSTRVGVVGVGNMGAAMARAVGRGGFPLTVYDPNAKACEALAAEGAAVASSPREVAAASDLVLIVVLNDDQVRGVLRGDDGILAAAHPGLRVVIHSTIHVETVLEVAATAADAGVPLLDAGVTGSVEGAETGQLATMVGGAPEVLEECRPVLDCYSAIVSRMGDLGAGMRAKVARQVILFLQAAALHEGMRLAEAAGVDLPELGKMVEQANKLNRVQEMLWMRGTAHMADPATDFGKKMIAAGKYTADIAEKDLGAALGLARDLKLDLPLTAIAVTRMKDVFGAR